jgi:hypothetical protein
MQIRGWSSPSMLIRGWRESMRWKAARAHPAARHNSVQFYQTLGAKSLSLSFICMPNLPAPPAQHQIEREPLPPNAKSRSRAGSTLAESCSVLASRRLGPVPTSFPLIPIGEARCHLFAPTRAEASAHHRLIFPGIIAILSNVEIYYKL